MGEMTTYGVIDIGANTIRLNIYRYENGVLNTLLSKKNVAGLASYKENGKLSQKGIVKLELVLRNLLRIYDIVKTEKLYAFATASLRDVKNLDEVLSSVKNELGVDIEIIEQEKEARLGFAGIRQRYNEPEGITIDIGGGSVEIVKFKDYKEEKFLNLDEGCLSLYSKYSTELIPTCDELKVIQQVLNQKMSKISSGDVKTDRLLGIGGTVRACGNIINELGLSDNTKQFTLSNIKALHKGLKKKDPAVIKTVLQVVPERIHTIVTGSLIVKFLLEWFGAEEMLVCDFGLREGFILEKISEE